MANTKLNQSTAVQKWTKDFYEEYTRESGLASLMGQDDSSPIKMFKDLKAGDSCLLNVPHIGRLRGAGVSGSTMLMGNEEALANYNYKVTTQIRRHAVNILKSETIQTDLDLLAAAKGALKIWAADTLRTDLLSVLQTATVKGANNLDGTAGPDSAVAINTASATDLNAWITANADRVLFGSARGNNTNVFSTSIANVDATADRASPESVELLKRMVQVAGSAAGKSHIRPVRVGDGREYFYYLCGPNAFRDIKNAASMQQANRDARPRDVDSNPIFQDGDLIKDGIIYRLIPELADLTATGAAGVPLGTGFLLGAGGISMAYSQMEKPIKQDYDYGFQTGIGIEFVRGQGKTAFNGIDHGIATHFTASVPDA